MSGNSNAALSMAIPQAGLLDRFVVTHSMTGNFAEVSRVIRLLLGRMEGLNTILKDEPRDPKRLSAQNEANNLAAALLISYQQALHFAEVMHQWALSIAKRRHKMHRAEKRAAKLARLTALMAAYWEIERQFSEEAEARLREYAHQKLDNKAHSIVEAALHRMSELIAKVMECEGSEEEAVRIVATAFVTHETVSRALDQLKRNMDPDVSGFAEHLTQGDSAGKIQLIAEITEDVLTRDARHARLHELMQAQQPPAPPPAPHLRPASEVDLPGNWMDTLLEIKLMGLIRELGPALSDPQHQMKGRLKIKEQLLSAMNDARPRERLLEEMEKNIASVRQQILSHLNANQGLQNTLAPLPPMPASGGSGSGGITPFSTRPAPTLSQKRNREEEDEARRFKVR